MNHSIYSADRTTHIKIVAMALVAGIVMAGFGISVRGNAMVTQGASAYPLQLGDNGNPGTVMRGRPAFPMQLGKPSISRGATC